MKRRALFILMAGLLVLWSCNKNDTSNQQLGQVSACFGVAKDTVYTGDTILFIGCSNNASTLLYNFGDGTTSSLRSPIHVFTQSGTYSVSLRATNQSQSNTTSKTIVVKASISANQPWRYFAPGSNFDSMVFYRTGPGTFNIVGYDILDGHMPVPGSFVGASSFSFATTNCCSVRISGSGSFLGDDSIATMTLSIFIPPANQNDPGVYQIDTFYGVRR